MSARVVPFSAVFVLIVWMEASLSSYSEKPPITLSMPNRDEPKLLKRPTALMTTVNNLGYKFTEKKV